MSRILTVAALFWIVAPASAWTPATCNDRAQEVRQYHKIAGRGDVDRVWREYLSDVRAARPGASLYAPHPFPKDGKEVVANFKHAYFDRLFEGGLAKVPENEQAIFLALQEGRLRFAVVKVENWGLSRCNSFRPIPHYYLLRIFDPRTGKEVARSTQHHTGLMGLYVRVSERTHAVPDLGDLVSVLRERFAFAGPIEAPQYVNVDGLPYCQPATPCIGFKSKGSLYLLDGGELLYEVAATSPRRSVLAQRDNDLRAGLRGIGEVELDAPMVTLGFEWARARRVAARPAK